MELNEAIEELYRANHDSDSAAAGTSSSAISDDAHGSGVGDTPTSTTSSVDEAEAQQQQPRSTKPKVARDKVSLYETVIEDLRDNGLAELADQILHLTAIDIDTDTDTDGEEEEEEDADPFTTNGSSRSSASGGSDKHPEKLANTHNQQVVQRAPRPTRTISSSDPNPGSKNRCFPPPRQMVLQQKSNPKSMKASCLEKQDAPSVIGISDEDYAPYRYVEAKPDLEAPPTQTCPVDVDSETEIAGPGAYSVTPGRTTHDTPSREDEIDASSFASENFLNPRPNAATATATGTGNRIPSQGLSADQEHNTETNANSGALELEAVRVDDYITVKAEPLAKSNVGKVLVCVSCAVVVIVLVLALALTRNPNDDARPQPTPSPTYDEDTRFHLIQEILLQEFAPLYNQNYNTTNGTFILQEAFWNQTSPQSMALHWIARNDSEIQNITRPSLDELIQQEDFTNNKTTALGLPIFGDNGLAATRGGNRHRNYQRQLTRDISRQRLAQRYALAVLYYSTYVNWTNSFEFLSAEHECDWSGALRCDEDHQIVYLDLKDNQLEGTIPIELATLTKIQTLNLASNALVGTLPPSLYTLSKLTSLDLGLNKFTGTIPDVFYQHWNQLQSWSLSQSSLTGTISTYIGNLGRLTSLIWDRNSLHGPVPSEFWSKLTNMEELDLSQQAGKFTNDTIGAEIEKWTKLRSLIYHGLDLRGTIPSELGLLTLLERLQIGSNDLSGTIPTELGLLHSCTWFSIGENALTGTIPSSLIHLSSLERFYVQNSLLSGDVDFMCDAIENGTLPHVDPFRVDMMEVSGCTCCTCCKY